MPGHCTAPYTAGTVIGETTQALLGRCLRRGPRSLSRSVLWKLPMRFWRSSGVTWHWCPALTKTSPLSNEPAVQVRPIGEPAGNRARFVECKFCERTTREYIHIAHPHQNLVRNLTSGQASVLFRTKFLRQLTSVLTCGRQYPRRDSPLHRFTNCDRTQALRSVSSTDAGKKEF